VNKVDASQVEGDFQHLGKGGFGSVFKVKLDSVSFFNAILLYNINFLLLIRVFYAVLYLYKG